MEFSCNKEDLYKGVQSVEKIVSTKSTLPIIGNILFEARKSGLKISANNLEMGMEMLVPAKVAKEGAALIPAKTIAGIVSKLPDGEINFKLGEKDIIKLSYKESVFNLHSLPPDEFPSLPKVKEGREIEISPELFTSMVKQTIFAVSQSEDKYVLNGILLELGKSGVSGDLSNFRFIATDGYRLARRGEKISGGVGDIKAIIPSKTLEELAKVVGEDEEPIKIVISSDQISFKHNKVYLVSRLIQGQFPDYKQVIPKSSGTRLILSRKELLEASERAQVIAASTANIVKFELRGKKLHLIASSPDVGSVDEVLDADVKGEGKAAISFNVKLVSEALRAMEDEKVALEISSSLSPGALRPAEGVDYVYIVMPIRTTETEK
ncbi:MAG: DNA polymerase III subunit beta [Candidatus Saganbacteria bacterium]|nr:DNA polymerase III subunit beta [Candidatus Saganbacteria bacterium]